MTKTNMVKAKLGWELYQKVYRTLWRSREDNGDGGYELSIGRGKVKVITSI